MSVKETLEKIKKIKKQHEEDLARKTKELSPKERALIESVKKEIN